MPRYVAIPGRMGLDFVLVTVEPPDSSDTNRPADANSTLLKSPEKPGLYQGGA